MEDKFSPMLFAAISTASRQTFRLMARVDTRRRDRFHFNQKPEC